ncbi:MAG: zinc ribbon domain-containing protein [Verrucomicrobia bacterium]|nr:zinc ribbon domain-containing protein [Verrucomicrobiota bacterium]
MPTYEYACEKCGRTFDKFQPIADAALKTCPKEICAEKKWGRGKVKRVIGAGGGLIFKGSGFYITDYRSDNYKAGAKKETPASTGGEAKPAASGAPGAPAKTEVKPAKPAKPAAT